MTLNSQSTLVCFADSAESHFLKKHRPDLMLLHTGMGRRNAAKSVKAFLQKRTASAIISAGFAGGLHPDHKVATILYESNSAQMLRLPALCDVRRASFLSSDRLILTADEKKSLWKQCGKDAVEMESATICKLASQAQIPCLTIRAICDAADEDLPLDFQNFMTKEMRMHFPKLLSSLIFNPRKIAPLIRFKGKVGKAARRLAETISAIIPP